MSEEMLIKHCSPTILGLKTGNMFTCRFETREEEHSYLSNLNKRLTPKGLRILPLCNRNGSTLIYMYRPSRLQRDLRNSTADKILRERGYCCKSMNRCIVQLVKKLRSESSFPHEIGLFLGYPPEDVCGFIENKAEDCKCVGCWKVYGDADKAQLLFDKYKKCTQLCRSLFAKGCTLDKLAVLY